MKGKELTIEKNGMDFMQLLYKEALTIER